MIHFLATIGAYVFYFNLAWAGLTVCIVGAFIVVAFVKSLFGGNQS
jgi:hypothetical protein